MTFFVKMVFGVVVLLSMGFGKDSVYAQSNLRLSLVRIWSGQENGSKPLSNPGGLCFGSDGSVYVADTGNHRLAVFDSAGNSVNEIGGQGVGSYQFNRPSDVTAKLGLDILVADAGNHRIERFNRRWGYIATITNTQAFTEPLSVDVSSFGDIFVLDGDRRQVVKIDVVSNQIVEFGGIGSGSGELADPKDIAVQGDQSVWVADGVSGKVIQFDLFSNYLQSRQLGAGIEALAVAVWDNSVWIATGNRVGVFSERTSIRWVLESQDLKQLGLTTANDLCVNQDSVVILDSSSGKLAWFRIIE